ncbi:MAG: Flp pilus assembly protein CpaB [Candidatus Aquicultorales bacterium]
MKTRVIVVVVSIALGLLATVGVASYINGIKSRVDAEDMLVTVVVAQENIAIGRTAEDLMNEDMLVEKKVPRKYAVTQAVGSLNKISNQVVAQALAKGEQVTTAKFKDPEEIGFSYRVPEGKRAVSVEINEERGVSKMLMPHDHVDVLVTFNKGNEGQAVTRILLQDVEVLAIDRTTLRPGEDAQEPSDGQKASKSAGSSTQSKTTIKATATLAVAPTDTEKLVFGAEVGELWLTLLPGTGGAKATTGGQTITTIFQ